jgi:hypothetical protein
VVLVIVADDVYVAIRSELMKITARKTTDCGANAAHGAPRTN